MHRVVRVRPGERVLVRGAAGGVGTALLDVVGRTGARTAGAASGDDQAIVTAYGAEFVDRADDRFGFDVAGFDVVFDPAGAGGPAAALLRPGGGLVTYGFLAALQDQHPRRSALSTMARLRLRALLPGGRRAMFYRLSVAARRDPGRLQRTLATLVGELAAGRLRPLRGARLPFDEAAEAHRLVAGRARGKVLLLA